MLERCKFSVEQPEVDYSTYDWEPGNHQMPWDTAHLSSVLQETWSPAGEGLGQLTTLGRHR